MNWAKISNGAQVIADAAQDSYDLWRRDEIDDAAAVAEQIVKDCQALLSQAAELANGLKSLLTV